MSRTPVRVAVAAATRTLATAGVPSARAEAELLAAYVLGTTRGRLALVAGFSSPQLGVFQKLVSARAERVPLQHLTGRAPFGHLELAVGPGVFIPRPETELVAQWAVAAAPMARVVVDLCSGTGALAFHLARALPAATVYAVEREPAALGWLRRNAAERTAAGDRPVEVVAGDATDPGVLADLDGAVDLVVCNPPYVPTGAAVAPEVAGHDPPGAVFAGADGLAVIRPVVSRAGGLLRSGGRLALEHDDSHGELVPHLLRRDGRFTAVAEHRDLAGRPRFATATRA